MQANSTQNHKIQLSESVFPLSNCTLGSLYPASSSIRNGGNAYEMHEKNINHVNPMCNSCFLPCEVTVITENLPINYF